MKNLIKDSIGDWEAALKNNNDLQEKFKSNPIEALKNVEIRNARGTDYGIYRIIVIMLGLALLQSLQDFFLFLYGEAESPKIISW